MPRGVTCQGRSIHVTVAGMRRTVGLVMLSAVATVAVGCGDDTGAAAAPETLTVETYNVGLAGAFIPFEAQRRAAMGPALAADTSDVICVQEAWLESDKEAIATAVRARFPYVARWQHSLETAVDSEIDPMCPVVPESTGAPCASMGSQTSLNAGLSCLTRNCSTMPNSEMGQTTSTSCAQAMCVGEVANLITTGAEGLRCYGCLAPNLPTETFASIRSQCTTNPRAGLAFGGQSGVMILSRYPLSNTEVRVMPGTWNRRVIARATVNVPGRAPVNVYCNHLTPVFNSIAFPYTGRYGCGETGPLGWESEQRAQARRLAQYVTATAGANPAVIAGDFNAGPEQMAAGRPTIQAEAEDTFNDLRTQFTHAVAANYVPSCTYCGDNFLTGGTDPVWIDHVFLRNLSASSVLSTERTHVEASVAVPTAPNRVPLSDHYGLRVTLRLP